MLLLAKAAKTIPIGTAYPVWTGIGAVDGLFLSPHVLKDIVYASLTAVPEAVTMSMPPPSPRTS